VEAFCTTRHLAKEDKSPVAVGDTLSFKVIEFNRDAKRILVSHLRTWEERKEAAPKAAKKAAKAEEPALDLPKVEKTTLGDLSALAELKASLEAEAKPAKAAKAAKAEEPAEEKPAKKAAAKKTAKKDAE
ncbi:MAG: 30S ribosomal protein S1, partial [Paludibacteraceae bacterium]|nr:30S ribosomal protein S1 [Paludibacteraceae bacterium]